MDYRKFTLEEFILDENFKKWVKDPNGEQSQFWLQWLELNPDKVSIINEARKILLTLSIDKDDPFSEELEELWGRIETSNTLSGEVIPLYKSSSLYGNILKYAAAFVGFLIIGTLIYFTSETINTQKIRTAHGATENIILPDGSQITLNSNSYIKYYKDMNEGEIREVWLEGEAYFSVIHKKDNQKFIVHTSDMNVEVLGTQFNVNNRRGKTSVVLNTGKVKLDLVSSARDENIYMKPGDLVVFSEGSKIITKKVVQPEDYSAWRKDKLVFKDNSLEEIAHILSDNYGIEVVFESEKLSQLRFTGTIQSKNIEVFTTVLEKALNLDVSLKLNQIEIKDKSK